MQLVRLLNDPLFAAGRRAFIGKSGVLLSATAVALLAGREGLAAETKKGSSASVGDDVRILNTALGAEQQAIAAYQVGAESGLLEKPVLSLAVQFQGHHKEHADILAKTISKLGGKPVAALQKYTFPTDKLKNQADVLRFAAGLEQGAVSAYLGAVPAFHNRDLSKAAASILGDEAMHWAILRQALGENPVPSAFVSYSGNAVRPVAAWPRRAPSQVNGHARRLPVAHRERIAPAMLRCSGCETAIRNKGRSQKR